MNIFEEIESHVRSYCRAFPAVFSRATGAYLYSESGKQYLDFFTGAGTLNYGHNNEYIKNKVVRYLQEDNVLHALDMHTTAKRDFLEAFRDGVLKPRSLNHKVQFCGPTGTNAVEAALKLARKVKKRPGIFAFTGAFHGMTLGALAVSACQQIRAGAGVPLSNVSFMPYPSESSSGPDSIDYIDSVLNNGYSGIEKPAAIIFETVQAEGGVNVAPTEWMKQLRDLCDRHDVLLICDDIQVGCFRTGPFFSFERANIVPDLIVLSKSISGLGLPMSLVLMKPKLDVWKPGEHTGTFRGNQMAFVGATAALEYAAENELTTQVKQKEGILADFLRNEIAALSDRIEIRGIGMIWGLDFSNFGGVELTKDVSTKCFEQGLIVERAGRNDTVVKLLPPLTIDIKQLQEGCLILQRAVSQSLEDQRVTKTATRSTAR